MKNYLKIKKFSLLFNYYLYVDTSKYLIDSIIDDHGFPASWLKEEFHNENSKFIMCILKCTKYNSEYLTELIFPELHNKLWKLYGGKYLDFVTNVFEPLDEDYKKE